MTSTYSNALRLEKPASGDYNGAWAGVANTQFDLIDAAIASATTISTTSGTATLTANDGVADQARAPIIKVTSVLVGNLEIVIPNKARTIFVSNETSGSYTVGIRTASGSAITITQGYACWVRCDGANVMTYASPQVVPASGSTSSLSASAVAALAFGPFTAIASATTTTLANTATVGASITGTTTITSFGTGANLLRIIKFAAALTLTHNATSLILPGGLNITTAANDTAIALSDGSSNWTVVNYTRADGTPLALGNSTVTYAKIQNVSATDKILGRSTAGAGVVEEITCTSFARSILDDADAATVRTTIGAKTSIVQIVDGSSSAVATGTTTIPVDDTIPQITEGTQFMAVTITPTSSTNKLLIEIIGNFAFSAGAYATMALFQDSTANALAATTQFGTTAEMNGPMKISYYMTAGTTSATTFRMRAGPSSAATITFNGAGGGRFFGGVFGSIMRVREIAP